MLEELRKMKKNALSYDEFMLKTKPNLDEIVLMYFTINKNENLEFEDFLGKIKLLNIDNKFYNTDEIIEGIKETAPFVVLDNENNKQLDVIIVASKNIIEPTSLFIIVLEALSRVMEEK